MIFNKHSALEGQHAFLGASKYHWINYDDDIDKTYANDGVYLSKRRYTIVVIDKDPDTNLVQKVTNLPMSRFDRHFKKDNLNHYIFNVYF